MQRTTVGHIFIRATITIYTMQHNGTSCLPLREDIGHAIGHVLGLDDKTNGACDNRIMGRRTAGTTRSAAQSGDECAIADAQNQVFGEPGSGGGGGCLPFLLTEPVPTESTVLALNGGSARKVETGMYALQRTERVDGITYLLDEWAVIAPTEGPTMDHVALPRFRGHQRRGHNGPGGVRWDVDSAQEFLGGAQS